MNKFLYTMLGLVLISSNNACCMKTKEHAFFKRHTDVSLQDIQLSIALLHDFESNREVENLKINQDIIKRMINDKKYKYCIRQKANIEQYIEATFPAVLNEIIKCVDIFPLDVNEEIKYKILFFLARTGLHKYCSTIQLLTDKTGKNILDGFNFFKDFILNNPKLADLYKLEKTISKKQHVIYRHNESGKLNVVSRDTKPTSGYTKIFSYCGTYEKKFLQVIYSMYGIKRETIEEMSRYDVLKYYNELKYTIRTDVTRIPVVIDKMYHIIKSCMDFSRHSIVLRNQDLNSSLIKTVNMNVEQVSPQTVIVQKCTDLNQSHASERQIHDDDNIDVASLSIFNVYNVLSPYCVNVSPSYAVKVGESLSYSMPLFGADTHRTFIILPIVVHITDREFYIVNTITFDNGTFFLCRQSIKNEQQIPFNEYVTSSNIIDGIKCNSIAASVNLDGNVVSITPMLTKNAFNQLMLINCATIDGSERYLYS